MQKLDCIVVLAVRVGVVVVVLQCQGWMWRSAPSARTASSRTVVVEVVGTVVEVEAAVVEVVVAAADVVAVVEDQSSSVSCSDCDLPDNFDIRCLHLKMKMKEHLLKL